MKKKVLSIVLSLAMVATVLAGCGKTPTATESTPESKESASVAESTPEETVVEEEIDISEHVTLTWYLHGSNVKDDTAVLEKVNEYLKEKINASLKPIWGTWGDFDENVVLSLQGSDDVDIYFTCSWSPNEYIKFARDGYWVQLDDPENNLIEKYAKETWAMLPDVLTQGAKINGINGIGVYAIPGNKDYATQNCWDVNVTLLEKYGYTIKDIEDTDFYGFGDILETVKAGEGKDFYPLLIEGAVLERMVTNSIIVTGDSGVANMLSYYINPEDVSATPATGNVIQNKFATEEYKKFVEKVREYYEAGYIDPAMANKQQANDVRKQKQLEAAYLIGTQSYSRGYELEASAERKIDVAMVPCTPAYVDTTSTHGAMMAVSSVSKNPERAVMFLNLLNTDPYLMTLLEYGVEGVHYEINENGHIAFTEESANYKPWINGMGNVTQLPVTEEQGDDNFWQEFKDYYAAAGALPILGYSFNPTPVENEFAALANICDQYALALSTGFVDPATELPAFLQKLEDNGMQKVIDEANVQLNDYLSN